MVDRLDIDTLNRRRLHAAGQSGSKYVWRMVALLLACLAPACVENPADDGSPSDVLPVVRETRFDYGEADIRARLPDTLLLHECVRSYAAVYSERLKETFFNRMSQKVVLLGLDALKFLQCIEATGQQTPEVISLPYLGERATYEGRECWILEFTWGLSKEDLGHFRCFVMDIATCDTLYYLTCR